MKLNRGLMNLAGLLATIAGGLSGAVGLWVLIGWYSHNTVLIRVLPAFRLMEFNTALGFLLCGFGLIGTVLGRRHLTMALGGMIGAIGLLTLIQYILGIDLGIDQFFIEDTMSPEVPTPGRMAPYTALSFLFTGSTLLFIGSPFGRTVHSSVLGILGSAIACLGLVVFLCVLRGVEADYVWAEVVRMERHTAAGFITLGLGIIGFAWGMETQRGGQILDWSSMLVFISLELIVLFLWQGLTLEESKVVKGKMESLAMAARKEITSEIESRVLALVRMAKRWEVRGRPSRAVWESDVSLVMKHQRGYRAIEWVDPSLRVRWTVPQDEHEATQFLDRGLDPEHKVALERIRNRRGRTVTQSIHLVRGREGFLVYVPIFLEEDLDGFILGVFNSRQLFRTIFPERTASGYFMALFDGAKGIVGRGPDPEYVEKWAGKTEVNLYDTSWELMFWPNQKFLAKWGSAVPEMILGIGTLITLLLSWRVYQVRTTEQQVLKVRIHKLVQKEVKDLNRQMKLILDTSREGIYGLDLNGNITFLTPTATSIIGWKASDLVNKSEHAVLHHSKPDGTPYLWKDCPICSSLKYGIVRHVDDEVFWKKDGSSFPVDYTSTPLCDEHGDQSGVVVAFRNITDFKRWEEEIQALNSNLEQRVVDQAEQLNHSNQETIRLLEQLQRGQGHLLQLQKMASIGQLVTGIVNEINNSIAYLRSNLGVLSDYVEDILRLSSNYDAILSLIEQGQMEKATMEIKQIRNTAKAIDFRFLSEDLRGVIQESREGVEQVGQIIRNLSDYSQGGDLNHKPFNLNQGLENTLKLVWNELKHRAEVEKELGSIPEILCCPQELNQVFMNLLINAAEAIQNKGKIWVRTYSKKDRIIVEVEDTGIGIVPENLGKVFDPFFTTKSDIKRTGLGLWASKEIIKKHGGEIEVESVLGKRTKFLVHLPMMKQEEGET